MNAIQSMQAPYIILPRWKDFFRIRCYLWMDRSFHTDLERKLIVNLLMKEIFIVLKKILQMSLTNVKFTIIIFRLKFLWSDLWRNIKCLTEACIDWIAYWLKIALTRTVNSISVDGQKKKQDMLMRYAAVTISYR